jgi:hypothetical protein
VKTSAGVSRNCWHCVALRFKSQETSVFPRFDRHHVSSVRDDIYFARASANVSALVVRAVAFFESKRSAFRNLPSSFPVVTLSQFVTVDSAC